MASDDFLGHVERALGQRSSTALIRRHYKRGHDVVMQGDPNTGVFVITRGHAMVRVGTDSGAMLATTALGPGDVFGEIAAVNGDETRSASVTALDELDVVLVPARDFEAVRGTDPDIDRAIVARFAARIEDLGSKLHEALHETVQRRCERRLVELSAIFADDGGGARIPLTQQELAELAGATRPTVNQVLQQLEAQRLIALGRGEVVVPDRAALARYVR